MRVRFGELARRELLDARAWYARAHPGLARQFGKEVRDATLRIGRTPLLYPVELADVHRYVLNRFPYVLRYVLRGDLALIVAVAHQHRDPDYWVERIAAE